MPTLDYQIRVRGIAKSTQFMAIVATLLFCALTLEGFSILCLYPWIMHDGEGPMELLAFRSTAIFLGLGTSSLGVLSIRQTVIEFRLRHIRRCAVLLLLIAFQIASICLSILMLYLFPVR